MIFLKKPWALGAFNGLVFSVLGTALFFLGIPIFDFPFFPIPILIGIPVGIIAPFRNMIMKCIYIGSITGILTAALLDLLVLFLGGVGVDPSATIGFLLFTSFELLLLGVVSGLVSGIIVFLLRKKSARRSDNNAEKENLE